MTDPTDSHPVADDPSGIVQQMPETVGGDALKPCPFCGQPAEWEKGEYGDSYPWNYIACSSCEAMGPATPRDLWNRSQAIAAWNRRATEADLRAEVERLQVSLMAARKGLQGVKEMALRGHQRNTIMQACETEQVKLDIALSPETDGGQDG